MCCHCWTRLIVPHTQPAPANNSKYLCTSLHRSSACVLGLLLYMSLQ